MIEAATGLTVGDYEPDLFYSDAVAQRYPALTPSRMSELHIFQFASMCEAIERAYEG